MKPMSQIQIQYFNIDAILIISKGTAYIFESDWLKPISKKLFLQEMTLAPVAKINEDYQ